jgi:endonuclease G, mitochondrial
MDQGISRGVNAMAKPSKPKARKTAAKPPPIKKKKAGKVAGGSKASEHDEALQEKLRRYIRLEGEKHLADPNVTSIGIGYKQTEGKKPGALCIQFTVGKKLSRDTVELEALRTKLLPESIEIEGERVPTDVIQRSYRAGFEIVQEALPSKRKQRQATISPGLSVSHPSATAGTLGAIVFDRQSGAPCMLSNWHVLHTLTGAIGDKVVQPGPFDDNNVAANTAGVLVRSHLGLAGDCAIARIEGRGIDQKVIDLGVQPKQLAKASLDDRVVKSGRTTDVTYGIVNRIDVVSKIDYGGNVGTQSIGGIEITSDPKHPAKEHEISKGGDSGSVWLVADNSGKATDVMVGLHFAGSAAEDEEDHALACYAHSVFQKLEISFDKPGRAQIEAAAPIAGYNEDFLSERVPPPQLPASLKKDAVQLDGDHLIHYVHFSVCLSKSRRFPRFVVWNIDGNTLRKLKRSNNFRVDKRVLAKFQTGNEVYEGNKLDRGHIARRADLGWGTVEEAKLAEKDSFFYTNITPQHERYNQSKRAGLWGRLEDAIYEDVDVENLRISVAGGPVLHDDDLDYRGIKIPREFWKVIAFKDTEDSKFKAKAYILSQNNLLNDLEVLELDPFKLFEVSLDELENRTDLNFSALKPHSAFSEPTRIEMETIPGARRGVREIFERERLLA